MASSVTTIRNVGPAVEAACLRAGIRSAEELRELGADDAYARMIRAGSRPHVIGYYSLVMGLQGRPWNDCRGAEKDALRARFDAIRAQALPQPVSDLDRALAEIGVVEKRAGSPEDPTRTT